MITLHPESESPSPEPEPVPDFRALMARIAQVHPTWTAEAVREAAIAHRRRARGETA